MARWSIVRSCGNMKLSMFFIVFNILDVAYRVVQSVDGHAQGFIQTDSELSHVADVLVHMSEPSTASSASAVSFSDLEENNLNIYASPILFEPSVLNFEVQPVGIPSKKKVIIKNSSPESSIQMLSISGNSLHFHCSFFQDRRISPGGNTSFDVVFLGRHEGLVENTLFIHTSLGSFKYQVTAVGKENPYRLRPFVGAKMPLNSSYTPLIYMHNPHSATLQVTEIYSSGGDLHLELPDGENDERKELWTIPPYETRSVMRANFVSRLEKNHTAYIRIITNGTSQDYLVLPVEVEVTSAPGIYTPTEILDFGMLRSQDKPKTLPINLLNSGQKHVYIVNVIVTPVNEAVEVKFTPAKVPPDTVKSTQIATVTYIPSKVKHIKQCSGKIVVKSKNNQYKLTIPFYVTFLNGSLNYNENSTRFYIGRAKSLSISDIRPLNVSNTFSVPVVIHNVTLQPKAKSHFTIIFNKSTILQPEETHPVVYLKFHPEDINVHLTSSLRLHTNISHFDIPLSCFNGKLKVFLPHALHNETLLDFGTLGIGQKRTMVFAVINENPVDVTLERWSTNLTEAFVEFVGLESGNVSTLARRYNFSDIMKGLTLKPQHYAIFRVLVTAPDQEGIFFGEVSLITQFEILKVYFTMRTAKGSLTSDPVIFDNSFPGRVSSQNLYIHSTFSHSMTVTSVRTVPEDSRFYFEVTQNASPVLQPRSKNWAGKLYFDPRRECKHKCYSGLPTTTTMGHQWLLGLSLSKDVGDIDSSLFNSLRERWAELQANKEKTLNLTLKVDTSEVQGFLMKAQVSFQWPELLSKCHLRFPITQIGNITIKEFTLENPSSLPLLVQVLPMSLYPDFNSAVTMASYSSENCESTFVDRVDMDVFTLQDLEEYNPSPDNVFPAYRKSLEEYFGVQPNRQSLAFLLTPGMRVRLKVGFSPKDDHLRTSLILIRNNLTVLSTLVVKGQGGYGQIRLGNKSPGFDSTLMFELTDNHLKDCNGFKNNKFVHPHFTVRRAFTARNTGELPVYIKGFYISGKHCEGYGFRVLDCSGFELKPNASRRVDIAFTPDFTLSRVERVLQVYTSLGKAGEILLYNLVATIPRHKLAVCQQALPRPSWEPLMYCIVVASSGFLIIGALAGAYLERDRILQAAFFPITTSMPSSSADFVAEKTSVFDLKNISSCNVEGKLSEKSIPLSHSKKKDHPAPFGVDVLADTTTTKNATRHSGSGSSLGLKGDKDLIRISSKDLDLDRSASGKNVRKRALKSKQRLQEVEQHHHQQQQQPQQQSQSQLQQQQNTDCEVVSEPAPKKNVKKKRSMFFSIFSWFLYRNSDCDSPKLSVATQTAKTSLKEKNSKTRDNSISGDDTDIKARKSSSHSIDSTKLKKKADEEETSSTTTETSNPDSDLSEKDPHLPDVCAFAKPSKSRRSKSKSLDLQNSSNTLGNCESSLSNFNQDDIIDDREFEISTKGRSHKRVKVDPKKIVYGGDILRPSTLELPYKPKPLLLNQDSRESSKADSNGKSNKIKNTIKINEFKLKGHSSSCENESDSRKGSPPPVWDQPKISSNSADDPLAELARQTENFSIRHAGRYNRPATYSAAVAGGKKSKPKSASFSLEKNSSNFPGAVGQKPPRLLLAEQAKKEMAEAWAPHYSGDSSGSMSEPFAYNVPDWSDKLDDEPLPSSPPGQSSDDIKQQDEISPLLRNICVSSSPSPPPQMPWVSRPSDVTGFYQPDICPPQFRNSEHAWPTLQQPIPGKNFSVDDWFAPTAPDNFLNPSSSVQKNSGALWNIPPSHIWGPSSGWWHTTAHTENSPIASDASPTETAVNIVSALGIDSPDSDVPEMQSNKTEISDEKLSSNRGFDPFRNIWAPNESDLGEAATPPLIGPISSTWSYSLFTEPAENCSQNTLTKPSPKNQLEDTEESNSEWSANWQQKSS